MVSLSYFNIVKIILLNSLSISSYKLFLLRLFTMRSVIFGESVLSWYFCVDLFLCWTCASGVGLLAEFLFFIF